MTRKLSLWQFTLIVCTIYCLTITIIEFSDQPISGLYSFLRTGALFGLVSFATCGVIALLSASKIVFSVIFPLLLSFSSAMSYFAITIGSRLSAASIEIALGNDAEMWFSVITPGLIASIIIGLIIGIILAWIRCKRVITSRKTSSAMAIGGSIIAIASMTINPKAIWTIGERLPYSLYYCSKEYINNKKEAAIIRSTYNNTLSCADKQAPDVVLIIGESLRADHLPMNGYERNTMPQISVDSLLINFSSIYTDYTNTNYAVPHILTRYSANDPTRMYFDQSFITLFKKAGYNTAWFANQNLTRFYSYFANEADTLIYCNNGKSVFHYEKTLDIDIIPHLDKWFNSEDLTPRLAVIHTIGSHWWYPAHYEAFDAQFSPEVKHKEIAGLSNEAIINSYDNTILATDRFISGVRKLVSNRNAIIIFISDHGELLGEDGCYLHDGNQEPLHRPALFMLPTNSYANNFPGIIDSLTAVSPQEISMRRAFHTILSLGRIHTPALNPDSTFQALIDFP